ncbi:DUF4148 domain-containing protein [Paraburkholderia sp. SIMBA_030]|uniref:DUF4148 domain-containing protein n=1 Tax=Paraburkholderia sp. SIMBA_030 TaxID=3085773 RepID=UPI00397D717A
MRFAFQTVVASVALLAPLLASAQQQGAELQRAQVRNELISLERAGYAPGYPASLPAAEARLSLEAADKTAAGYGPSLQGSSQSGHAANLNTAQSVYFGL